MRLRIYRYFEGLGVSTTVRMFGSFLSLLLYFALVGFGILVVIGIIYAIWPQIEGR